MVRVSAPKVSIISVTPRAPQNPLHSTFPLLYIYAIVERRKHVL